LSLEKLYAQRILELCNLNVKEKTCNILTCNQFSYKKHGLKYHTTYGCENFILGLYIVCWECIWWYPYITSSITKTKSVNVGTFFCWKMFFQNFEIIFLVNIKSIYNFLILCCFQKLLNISHQSCCNFPTKILVLKTLNLK